jgi:NADH:ubiquinone oxidoreductase subunit E
MSPPAGSGPNRPPTHIPLEFARLMKLASRVQEAAEDGVITAGSIDELASDVGVDRAHLYAASVLCEEIEIQRAHEIQLVVCTGGCQQWGALQRIEELLSARDDRRLGLDIVPRACLNRCDHAPTIEAHTPDGVALLPAATGSELGAALAELFRT